VVESAKVVLVTLPDEAAAESLVTRLVEERVVACGNIVPGLTSIYRWQGAVERAAEVMVVFKTTGAGAERLIRRVPELHPYDVPEVLVLPVESGHGPYLQWVVENVGENVGQRGESRDETIGT
jgi:periplasmic divalent cation tolerance protein